jgi:uridine kinase
VEDRVEWQLDRFCLFPLRITMSKNLSEAIALLQQHQTKPLLLVAIDGHSAAGKSTLARALQQHLPQVSIVQTDDFYRPLSEETRWALDAAGGYLHYYDWQRLAAQVLAPLRAGQESCYQKYDWAENRLVAWASVQSVGIVLIEGCYAARPELKGYYRPYSD